MEFTVESCEQRVAELYAEGSLWGEARAQWLESCLECEDQYLGQDLDDLEGRAYFWLQNMYHDCGYEWMEKALNEAREVVFWA